MREDKETSLEYSEDWELLYDPRITIERHIYKELAAMELQMDSW